MNRGLMLERLRSARGPGRGGEPAWDVLVVGGGATGLGIALDSALRGYRTALVDARDLSSGTSSRSTKLIHGGVRYLRQGDVPMVVESLRERGRLVRNAPGLVRPLPFVIPGYRWWETPYYRFGMGLYDLLAAGRSLGRSRALGRAAALDAIPGLGPRGDRLRGGTLYYDAQFDDARMAVALAEAAADAGAAVVNYCEVTGLGAPAGRPTAGRAVELHDGVSGDRFEVVARVVVNATGVFADSLRRMDDPAVAPRVRPSRGSHLVLDRRFLGGRSATALMIPETDDGRVLFAIPFHDKVLLGTTDDAVEAADANPAATAADVDYLLDHAARYLADPPTRADVLGSFAGLRPLVAARPGKVRNSAALSRTHVVEVSRSGLVSVMGGKWTTFRQMAEDAVDRAALVGQLEKRACTTAHHRLGPEHAPGAPPQDERIHPGLPYTKDDLARAVRDEMAVHLDDVLARRTRALVLDARAAQEIAPTVAEQMATEAGHPPAWIEAELERFEAMVNASLVAGGEGD